MPVAPENVRRRFVFAVWPYSGHVNPCLAVAGQLRARGHEVAFYTGAAARGAVEREGYTRLSFHRVAARLSSFAGGDGSDVPDLYSALTARYTTVGVQGALARYKRIRLMYREMIAGTIREQVADLEESCREWKADVIISDPMMWGPFIGLHGRPGLSVVAFSFFAGCLLPGPDAPPPGLGLPRPRSTRPRLVARAAARGADWLATDIRREASRIRQEFGLPPLDRGVLDLTAQAALYLVSSSPEYDYNRKDLPPSVQYVGPCLWDKSPSESAPDWMQDLPASRPIVYVTEGTAQVQAPQLLPIAVRALADLPLEVVITTGRHRDPRDVGVVKASNIHVHPWVAHSDLFPRLSAIVTNGGSGTVRGALCAGIPLVIVPMEWDQLENAQRVAEAGAGIRIPLKRCRDDTLRDAVRRVLEDPSFAANARRLGATFARYGNGDRAVDLLEQLTRCATPASSVV